jgi:tryptophanyl-tRNA synthetase
MHHLAASVKTAANSQGRTPVLRPPGSGGRERLAEPPRYRGGRSDAGAIVTTDAKPRIFSGVQPTGNIHLGNYLGAFRNWVSLQDSHDAIYCIVDLHAMTVDYDPVELEAARLETAKVLLALGVDPDRSLLYTQSQVNEHAELAWILGTMTPMGVLNRMTQFKDKTASGAAANLGLYSYPVLMAADILLYRADLVPIGDDQRQHMEMTRDLAERFNNRFGDVFPIPEAYIPETSARVMALTDPTSKMSKSDPQEKSRVGVLDHPDAIRKRIRSAVTDSDPEVRYDTVAKPGISNLLEIMSACTGRSIDDLVGEYAETGYGVFKDAVADAVIAELEPIAAAYARIDDGEVREVLHSSGRRAAGLAADSMADVRRATGIRRY